MLKAYITVSNKVKELLSNKKAVSHLVEVAGTLGLVALVIALVFPGARNTISEIWNNMIGKVQTFTNS
jgi:Flp pilus assembly pilin Flp